MPSKRVLYYRIYCETEGLYVYTWANNTPTKCPNNNAHTISTGTISVVDKVDENKIEISEESPSDVATSGRFRCDGLEMSIPTNTTKTDDFAWAYPISVMTIRFNSDLTHNGDYVNGYVIPTSFVGNTSGDINIGTNIIPVKSGDMSNISVGMLLTLTDTQSTQSLGAVVSKDTENNTITMQANTDRQFNKNSYIYYQTPVGILTSDVTSGDIDIYCNSTVTSNTSVGMILWISDGVNIEKLGEIFEIDSSLGKITIQNSPSNSYVTGSYIFVHIQVVKNYKISVPMFHVIGEGKIGGSYIKKGYIMRTEYTNSSVTDQKNFNWYVELLY